MSSLNCRKGARAIRRCASRGRLAASALLAAVASGGCAAEPPAAPPAAPPAEPPAAPLAATEPAALPAPAPAPLDFEWTTTPSGRFTVGWRPVDGPVPVNEPFEIDLRLFEDAARERPIAGASVRVSAWMPDHLHGMGRLPQTREIEPGLYRVKGLLLHMEGLWQLFVDVTAGAQAERAEFRLTLE